MRIRWSELHLSRALAVTASIGWLLAASPDRLPVLKHIRDVRRLSPAEAKRAYPVEVRGVVTFVDTHGGELFVQDETAGIFVFERDAVRNQPLQVGQLVNVTGVSAPADFAPSIAQPRVTVLGTGTLPRPGRKPFERLLAGREDSQWFELEGVVRSGHIKGTRLYLNVAAAGGSFLALMAEYSPDWNRKLVDARVVMQGVLGAMSNNRRQSAGLRIFVPGPDFVRIEAPAPPDVFRLPETPAISVGQFHPVDELQKRILVRATVMAIDPGMAMYVADATGNLAVQPIPGCGAARGDLLEVVGFPGVSEGRPGLQDALCRKVGTGPAITPVPVAAHNVIPPQIRTDPFGAGYAEGARYDGELIRTDGILLGSSYQPEGATLLLKSGEQSFTARLPAFAGERLPQWEAGSRLRLTGVCLVAYDQYHRAQFFRILLRGPRDVAVLARPSWWTLRHSLWTLSLLAAVCLAAFTWISVLRHQVATQTRQLRQINERLTELSKRDAVTQAFNRRHFDEVLEAEVERVGRSGRALSLIMVDIDGFKLLNDLCGHQQGDACLERVVDALESCAQRSADLVARYGGDEFGVILPDTDREGALRIAESMRARVASLAIAYPGARPGTIVTISVGVTTLEPPAEIQASRLVSAADRALYEAKRLGRNRAVYGDFFRAPLTA